MDNKLNRQNWLDAGLARLAHEGPGALKIMSIAQELGVTKGSFYWHFESHEDFQAALLEEWERRYTQHVIGEVDQLGGDPKTMLRRLMTITAGTDAKLGRAIRSWAMTNADARKAQVRVDRKRIVYVTKLLTAIGWPEDEAAMLARWTYGALIGHFSLDGAAVPERQIDLVLRILIPKAG